MMENEDLFSMLLAAYEADLQAACAAAGEGLPQLAIPDVMFHAGKFCEFAREALRKNPPVSTYVAERGVGLRLQDHRTVPLVYEKPTPLRRDAIAITQPSSPAGMEGVSERWAMPITKGE
jgi:hypothetical protein